MRKGAAAYVPQLQTYRRITIGILGKVDASRQNSRQSSDRFPSALILLDIAEQHGKNVHSRASLYLRDRPSIGHRIKGLADLRRAA